MKAIMIKAIMISIGLAGVITLAACLSKNIFLLPVALFALVGIYPLMKR